jgi:hypothetical protein
MLATRISFMNELANLADKVGADIELVRQGIGSDPRIGYSFLYAGTGYGGSCFPKDVQALVRTAGEHGQRLRVLEAVEAVNHEQKHIIVSKILARYGQDLSGRHFALWGLAFKPNTDDMRDAPSRVLIQALLRAGASIHAHDPVATAEARRVVALDLMDAPHCLERIRYADKPLEALPGADALVIMTEWKAYRNPGHRRVRRLPHGSHSLRAACVDRLLARPRRALRRQLLHRHQGQRRPPARQPALRADAPRRDLPAVRRGRRDLQPGLPGVAPIHYQHDPVQTTKTSVHGAINMLGLAKRLRARILQASTSEVYGDPAVHPQPRTTGATSTRSASAPATTKASAAPRRCSSTTTASTAADQGGAHLQHLRPAHAPQRRPRRQQLHRAGAARRGHHLYGDGGPHQPRQTRSFCYGSTAGLPACMSIPCPYRRGNLRASRPTSTHHEQRLSARYQCVVRVDAQPTGHCRA